MNNPLVSISCLSYNHVLFIRECLDSFLMQKTNFDFEIIIHDDGSTDGTKEVIEEYRVKYPSIIFPVYQTENQYSKGVRGMMAKFNFPRCKGKYIALCEGDDYWTDPLKLQKQVDFLENNQDFSICWTNYKIIENNELKNPVWLEGFFKEDFKEISFNNFSSPYCTYTLTCMFRRDCIVNRNFKEFKYLKDNTLYFMCLQKGKGAILNFFGGVYRLHHGGLYSSGSEYYQSLSNFTNYSEVLKKIPETRVKNILGKKKYWQTEYFKQLDKQPISTIKKYLIKWKYFIEFN